MANSNEIKKRRGAIHFESKSKNRQKQSTKKVPLEHPLPQPESTPPPVAAAFNVLSVCCPASPPPTHPPLQQMEDQRSVNSPRRTLSFSKNRKAMISFPYPPSTARDDKSTSGFGISGKHGPKPSEVYGFVGSFSAVVATVIFLIWAYVPDSWLHSIGIFYYPSRYWALTVPAYLMVTVVLAIGFYIGLNFMATPPPTSFNIMFDVFSREPVSSIPSTDNDEQPIEPISDISIIKINGIMFNN